MMDDVEMMNYEEIMKDELSRHHVARVMKNTNEWILEYLSHPNVQLDFNLALGYAIIYNSTKVAQRLIELGANVNFMNGGQWTPLHLAIDQFNYEFVCMLLYYNADVYLYSENMVPLVKAMSYKKYDILSLLLDYYFDEQVFKDSVMAIALFSNNAKSRLHFSNPSSTNWKDVCRYISRVPGTLDIFKSLYALINYPDDFFDLFDFLGDYMTLCMYTPSQFIEGLYFFFECSFKASIVEIYNYSITQSKNFSFYSSWITYCKSNNLSEEDRIKVIYYSLSIGIKTVLRDFHDVYKYYGYSKEFEALMYTGDLSYQFTKQNLYQILAPVPAYCLFLYPTISHSQFYEFVTRMTMCEVIEVINYFSLPPYLKRYVLKRSWAVQSPIFLKKLKAMHAVPLLKQLCRDNIRSSLLRNLPNKKPYQYVNVIKSLHPSPQIQNIILFKDQLYYKL